MAAGGAAGPNHSDAATALAGTQRENGGPGSGHRGAAAQARARSGTGEESQCVWEALLQSGRWIEGSMVEK